MIPAIQLDVGGVLSLDVPELGTLDSAYVSLRDPQGTEIRAEAAADLDDAARTVSTDITAEEAGTLFAVHGFTTDPLGRRPPVSGAYLYSALWRYTVGTTERRRRQVFEVRKHVATCPLSHQRLTEYDSLVGTRLWPGQTSYAPQIRIAWERDVVGAILSKGRDVHLCADVDQLEEPTALYALARIYEGWGADYRDLADDKRKLAAASLAQLFGRLTWYDTLEDGVAQDGELGVAVRSVRFSR